MLKKIINYLKSNQKKYSANKFAVLDYSGTHSLNAHTNCISNFNIRNRLLALTSFARQNFARFTASHKTILNRFIRQSRKSAFTLAETLIVMGIIGVVAALTLPNLNSSTGEKEKVAKVKKIYQNLTDAFGRAEAVYGPIDEWCINSSGNYCKARTFERITEFMKISKVCNKDNIASCVTTGYTATVDNPEHSLRLGTKELAKNAFYTCLTADGSSLVFDSNDNTGVDIYVDIDGPTKGKFTQGIDVFGFYSHIDTQEDERYDGTLRPEQADYTLSVLTCSKYGFCGQWIINHDNMDYLKVKSDGKCPDDQMLNDSHPTCK